MTTFSTTIRHPWRAWYQRRHPQQAMRAMLDDLARAHDQETIKAHIAAIFDALPLKWRDYGVSMFTLGKTRGKDEQQQSQPMVAIARSTEKPIPVRPQSISTLCAYHGPGTWTRLFNGYVTAGKSCPSAVHAALHDLTAPVPTVQATASIIGPFPPELLEQRGDVRLNLDVMAEDSPAPASIAHPELVIDFEELDRLRHAVPDDEDGMDATERYPSLARLRHVVG